jgi:hypothetical protein
MNRLKSLFVVGALAVVVSVVAAGPAVAAIPATFVHGLSPYPNPGGCHGAPQSGTLFVNSEVEPTVGDNDLGGTGTLIGTWQQDRFSAVPADCSSPTRTTAA